MSLGQTRRRAFMAAGALLCGLLVSTLATAQSSQLEDLMGMWVTKVTAGPAITFNEVYQATIGPASLTLRYMHTDVVSEYPGASEVSAYNLYQLTVTDRTLAGTVTVDTNSTAVMGCPFEQRTFPVKGRISPDWNTITIVENHETPTYNPCGWGSPHGDIVRQFERYH